MGENALASLHGGQLREVEVDYWIAMTEKVGTERLIHKGTPDGQSGNFQVNPSADREPMKPVYEVLNRRL